MIIPSITSPKSQIDWSSVKGNSAPSLSLIERIINLIKRILGLGSTTVVSREHHFDPIPKKEVDESATEADQANILLEDFIFAVYSARTQGEEKDQALIESFSLLQEDQWEQAIKIIQSDSQISKAIELSIRHGKPTELIAKLWCRKAEILNQEGKLFDGYLSAKAGLKVTGTSPETRAKLFCLKADLLMQNKEWDRALDAAKAGLELTGVSTETRAKLENLKESAEIVLQTLDSASKRASAPHQEKQVRNGIVRSYNCSIPGIVSVREPKSTS